MPGEGGWSGFLLLNIELIHILFVDWLGVWYHVVIYKIIYVMKMHSDLDNQTHIWRSLGGFAQTYSKWFIKWWVVEIEYRGKSLKHFFFPLYRLE